MRLPDLEAWAIFAAVAEAGSFTGAAAELGLSKATVSKAVARLEARLGQSLFHRTSRRLALTEGGRPLAERAAAVLAQARAAEEAALDAAACPAGRIRVAAPMSFGVSRVAPLVTDFLTAHPHVEVELHLSDARVDVVGEGFDLALRIADLPDSSLRARRLCGVPSRMLAARTYLAAAGRPSRPEELGHHALLGYTNASGTWRFHGPGDEEVAVRAAGPISANSGEALLPALLAGLGIARLPDFILGDLVGDDRLEEVLPDWRPRPIALNLLTPPGPLRPARVEALIAFLAAALKG